ncbi:MAG: hypothetical protein WAU57_09795 [Xanthobacteraceae bacterium]
MAKLANKAELKKTMEASHAQHFKLAGLLLAAHGGSLGTCVTIFKDTARNPQVGGVGVFALLFGIGLIASIAYYASVFMTRAVVQNALEDDEDPNDSPSVGFLIRLNLISLGLAVVTLLAAIVLVVVRLS